MGFAQCFAEQGRLSSDTPDTFCGQAPSTRPQTRRLTRTSGGTMQQLDTTEVIQLAIIVVAYGLAIFLPTCWPL